MSIAGQQTLLRRAIWALAISILLATALEMYGFYSAIDGVLEAVQEEAQEESDVSDQLRDLFEQADYEELVSVASAREQSHPNDTDVHYYLGRMHYVKQEFAAADDRFRKVLSISPDWKDSVSDYLSSAAGD